MKVQVQTENAPAAIGPYSQAIRANGFVYVSGQIPIDPQTGEFVAGGIREQTEQVLINLSAVLKAAGSGLERVVKTTVFLADMSMDPLLDTATSALLLSPVVIDQLIDPL